MAINVGTLAHDGVATPHQIALILPITGATDSDAVATCVYYRPNTGSPSALGEEGPHFTGHPLFRLDDDSAFCWPIIGLEPNTTYTVEVTVSDGGAPDVKTLSATTRARS